MELKSKVLLVVGCQRSGTTLLASMLGRHPEINMLFESITKDTLKLIGKEYSANKILAHRQIRIKQRSSKWGHLINRLANLDFLKTHRHHKRRPYPISVMSIKDYEAYNPVVITLVRNKEKVVNSITSRTGMNDKQAGSEYNKAMEVIHYLNEKGALALSYEALVKNPEGEMKKICKFLELQYEATMLEGSKYNVVYPHDTILKDKA